MLVKLVHFEHIISFIITAYLYCYTCVYHLLSFLEAKSAKNYIFPDELHIIYIIKHYTQANYETMLKAENMQGSAFRKTLIKFLSLIMQS